MRDRHDDSRGKRDLQAAALLASGGVILGFLLYWSIQVQSVRELLALAYG